MIRRLRADSAAKIVVTALVACVLVAAGGGAFGAPAVPFGAPAARVQLVGSTTNELACVDPTAPLPPGFTRRGKPFADFELCFDALLAELKKRKPPPARPSASDLSWYMSVNGGDDFMIESASSTLPLTHGVVSPVVRSIVGWAVYAQIHQSGVGNLTPFFAEALLGSTSGASSSAVAADAAASVTPLSPWLPGIARNLVGITEWTVTGLKPDGSIDQLIVCASTGQSKMLSLDRASVPSPTDLILPSTLSGGQLQRVGLSRALGPRATILILDAPTGCDHKIDVSGLGRVP